MTSIRQNEYPLNTAIADSWGYFEVQYFRVYNAFMRIVGLFALAIFFPAFAHADSPPTLTTYTVSYGTIYPSATAGSGLATTTSIDTAFSEQVKVSIKIISAVGATVKSLYSSSGVTNPTPKIWDGTNTVGTFAGNGTYTVLISATSTATSLTMSDSSKTIIVASSGDSGSSDSGSDTPTTTTTTTTGGAPPEYIPIPTLRIITGKDRTVSSGADTAFTATVYDGKGNKRDDAFVTWSFGDGMQRNGANVYHTYYYSGEYIAVVHVSTSDGGNALKEMIVTVEDAGIKITFVSARGISLTNNDSRTLDLSLWRLSMGGKEFKIPADTQILAGRTTLFPSQIIQLPISDTASLLYPSGEVATTYPTTPVEQPSSNALSYKKVSEVEPILSAKASVPANEKAVIAPSVATELAAVGAALPASSPAEQPRTGGLFKSPWFYSLLGVIALAGVAFIFI